MTQVLPDILDTIGQTPTIRLDCPLIPQGKKLFLKLEQSNPTFSVKDRSALGLVRSAIEDGRFKPGGHIIESTSGNIGKSLSMIGAVMGFKVTLVVDPKVGQKEINWYKAFGASVEIVTKPDANGVYQAARIDRLKELLRQDPDACWLNQYDNYDNPNYHYKTTGPEVSDITADTVVGVVSTGGHLSGVARYVKQHNPNTKIVACDVEGSSVFGGKSRPYLISGVGLSWRSRNTDASLFDVIYKISDQKAISMCHYVARNGGVLMGGSGGLACYGATSYLRHSNAISAIVIIPDTGTNYLETIYDDAWLTKNSMSVLDEESLLKSFAHPLTNIDYRVAGAEDASPATS